uniref:Uncharacterized protein n=1 Tax=Paludibacterium denitrificans TaxID=2675226 RepID=A0A844GH26_9NEIS|nr:hypothetical protein [Paludibacterium denitrificans]MTD34187.1 hypothetical protein [Paludibacterium denitrificans]
MSVSHIVDSLRHAAEEVGISADPMTKARNFVANLLFDRNYDQVKAAENARKFVQPQLDPLRTAKLIQESPHFAPLAKFCIAHFDAFMGHYEFIESVSSTNQAIRRGLFRRPRK